MRIFRYCTRLVLLGIVLIVSSPVSQASSEPRELWMTGYDMWSLVNTAAWPDLGPKLDTVGVFVDDVLVATQSQVDDLVAALSFYDIKLAVEMSGVHDNHAWRNWPDAAANTFQEERAKIAKLVTAGHPPDYLIFDGPVRRMLYPHEIEENFHTVSTAAWATINAMQYWKAEFPNIKIYVLSNFPNWGWKGSPAYHNFGYAAGSMGLGDYLTVFDALTTSATNAGVQIEGFMLDNPYDYVTKLKTSNHPQVISSINFWDRLKDFHDHVEAHAHGLKSAQIFNSERGGTTSNYQFWKDSLDFLQIYTNGGPDYAGGPNTRVTNIESWFEFPNSVLPDYTWYTLSNTAAHAWYYFDN